MKALMEFEVPQVPNFLKPKGFTDAISIARFSDDELKEIAAEWTKSLLATAQKRRKALSRRPAGIEVPK